ncbi:energy transducer TonB [Fibrella forsythiae]|uniref:Energy transducer TonB n=1 Tax=Fibrella forsythiae TaxID=2817061 RepID=A0ABS3JPV8_9BACT|nr:energy transducer TonB [Fibrella forsythiae]MBO0952031.1 energy transducer TonB [Fibrella forsythiae]
MHPRLVNVILLPFLFVISYRSAHAQAPVYKPFEVDSVAAPIGGQSMLETFLAVNVQKPFMARVANVTGKVFVTAVVDPNGRVSDVQLMRSLRPDCDREALRVMRLFNAWKPAIKSGQPVWQLITYPVTFLANDPVTYATGQRIEYFDSDQKPIISSQKARFQQTTAIDSVSGLPTGELVVSEIKGSGKLRELTRLPLSRLDNKSASPNEPVTYMLGHKQPYSTWYGFVYTLDKAGKLIRRHHSANNETLEYDSTGMVTLMRTAVGGKSQLTWHSNGLIKQVETFDKDINQLEGRNPYRMMSVWDGAGNQLVINGNGQSSHSSRVLSRASDAKEVELVETGSWVNGLKHGTWSGSYSDGSYSYSESFDKGKPLGGSATINGDKTITYTASQQNPEFKGGMREMYAFLGQNIRYPADAIRNGIQGKVFMAFTVCTDGTLCDFELLNSVHPSLDAEAERVVRASSGRWQPGYQRGEPVRVKYNIPISFQVTTTSTIYR